jgi:tRNA A37 threonylcarbamoyladenosine biosynthesis protein TsaE
MGNLLIHTKSTILYYELYRNLIQLPIHVLLTGKFDTGKSTLVKLLLSNLSYFSNTSSSPTKSPTRIPT